MITENPKEREDTNTCLCSFQSICIEEFKSKQKRIGIYSNHYTEEIKFLQFMQKRKNLHCIWSLNYLKACLDIMSVAIALHQKDLSTITILSSNLTLSISF